VKSENVLAQVASQDINPVISIQPTNPGVRRQADSGGATVGIGFGLLAAAFRTTFLTAALRGAAFFAAAFLAGAFFAAAFFAGAFFAGAFLAGAFLAGAFFAIAFFTTAFFGALFFVAVFFVAIFFAAVFFAGAFFVTALTMLELPSDRRQSVHTPTRGSSSVTLFIRRARGIACVASSIACKHSVGDAIATSSRHSPLLT
jgi:hypothetical protein